MFVGHFSHIGAALLKHDIYDVLMKNYTAYRLTLTMDSMETALQSSKFLSYFFGKLVYFDNMHTQLHDEIDIPKNRTVISKLSPPQVNTHTNVLAIHAVLIWDYCDRYV